MNKKTNNIQWKVRCAVQRLHKKYHKNPWIFMTEADVQCNLYYELMRSTSKARKTIIKDANKKIVHDRRCQVLTRQLHAELSSVRRKSTEFVDLCLIDPHKVVSQIKKTKFNRENKEMPLWDNCNWGPKDSIGIEIKFNRWIRKMTAYSRGTRRGRITKKWKNYRLGLLRDIKKLKRYKRGWLIFVDQHSLIDNYAEWRNFVNEVIRDSNYGRAKKTLNAYYLSPKAGRAMSYKSP